VGVCALIEIEVSKTIVKMKKKVSYLFDEQERLKKGRF
jgi:hypothetical protein